MQKKLNKIIIIFLSMLIFFLGAVSFASEETANLLINDTSLAKDDLQVLQVKSDELGRNGTSFTLHAGFISKETDHFYIYLSEPEILNDWIMESLTFEDKEYNVRYVNRFENYLGTLIYKYYFNYSLNYALSSQALQGRFTNYTFKNSVDSTTYTYQQATDISFGFDKENYYCVVENSRKVDVVGQVFYYDWDYGDGNKSFDDGIRNTLNFIKGNYPYKRFFYLAYNLYDEELKSNFDVDRIENITMSYTETTTKTVEDTDYYTDTKITTDKKTINNQLVEEGTKTVKSDDYGIFGRTSFTYDYIGKVSDITFDTKTDLNDYAYYSFFGNFNGYDAGTYTYEYMGLFYKWESNSTTLDTQMSDVAVYHITYWKDGTRYSVDTNSLIKSSSELPIVPGEIKNEGTSIFEKLFNLIQTIWNFIIGLNWWQIILVIVGVVVAINVLIRLVINYGVKAIIYIIIAPFWLAWKLLSIVWHLIKSIFVH